MIFGRGGRSFWYLRLGLLFLLFTAGSAFHYRGAGYWTVRALYYALIFSFVIAAVWRHRASRRGVGTGGPGTFSGPSPYQGGGMSPPFGGRYPPFGGEYPPNPPHDESHVYPPAGYPSAVYPPVSDQAPAHPSPADHPPSVPVVAPAVQSVPVAAPPAPPVPIAAPTGTTAPASPAVPPRVPQAAAVVPPVSSSAPVAYGLLSAPGQQPGWYPDPLDPMTRRYWDGVAWSHRLKWDGTTWVSA